jgi:uncharacterized SAM-binding protein YcdF (DUF218 family)
VVVDIIKALVMPSNLAILSLLMGILMLILGRFKGLAKALLIFGGSIILVFSSGIVAALLLSPLEYQYPYVKSHTDHPEVRKIVVLTGYAADHPLVPLSSKVNSTSAFRVLEAQRLHRWCQDCEIIISGNMPTTSLMKELLMTMGVPSDQIHEDSTSEHTYISAQRLRQWLDDEAFYLVTSAGHMPRAMGVFEKQGMKPIPAPTDYLLPKDVFKAGIHVSPQHLHWCNLAIGEYLGIGWYKLTDKI